jgi:hypothetical protein
MDSRCEKHKWQVSEQANRSHNVESACRVTFVKYTCRGKAFSGKIIEVILTFEFGRGQRLKHDVSGSPVPGHVCFDAVLSDVCKRAVCLNRHLTTNTPRLITKTSQLNSSVH